MVSHWYIRSPQILISIDCLVCASVFFGGVGLAFSQLALNVVLNSVSTGMDIAGLWPRFINIRRGAYIMAIVRVYFHPHRNLRVIDSVIPCSWGPHLTRGRSSLQRLPSSLPSRELHAYK